MNEFNLEDFTLMTNELKKQLFGLSFSFLNETDEILHLLNKKDSNEALQKVEELQNIENDIILLKKSIVQIHQAYESLSKICDEIEPDTQMVKNMIKQHQPLQATVENGIKYQEPIKQKE